LVRKKRKVETFEYPVKVDPADAVVDSLSIRMLLKPLPVLWLFHISMGLQLITGLVLFFAAPWVGATQLRPFHGYVGAFFTITFVLYIGMIAFNKEFRALRDPINYVEIVFYVGLIVLGFASSSLFAPLFSSIPFLGQVTPFHCTLLTFGWVVVSVFGGGGIVQGLAAITFLFTRSRSKATDEVSE
jgi:hypothetical protein